MAVSRRLALDTNVLFDRANEESFAKDFFAVFQRNSFSLEVPPTVIYELDYFRRKSKGVEQTAAETALRSVQKWGLTPLILTDVQKSYKKNFISIAQNANLLPAKEINDLHILAETAIKEIPALVTSDGPLLNVDRVALQLVFQNAGLPSVTPVHPRRMLQALR
jgi:predicted nucleic acid-binding protein